MRQRVSIGLLCMTACLFAVSVFAVRGAAADDKLKVAIGQINNWDNQVTQLGQRAGIFKKHGIVLDFIPTQGAGETLQAVIAGTDFGVGVATVGAMRAYVKGAPIRVLAATTTGARDIYWYVRANSSIKRPEDATSKYTIAYSTNGATSDYIVRAFAKELRVAARPIATGSPGPTLNQVLSGHVDIGWAAPPVGLQELQDGKTRILATGNDVPEMRDQTIRVLVVNAKTLQQRGEAVVRFMRAYHEALDWMYSDPQALKYYSEATGMSEPLLAKSRQQFHPKEALLPEKLVGLDSVMATGVKLGFLNKPLSQQQLSELFQMAFSRQ